jgi:hypothetical protein
LFGADLRLQQLRECEIRRFHGGDDDDDDILWVLAVDLRMETVGFSETLAPADKPTRHQNAEEHDQVREYRFTDSLGGKYES